MPNRGQTQDQQTKKGRLDPGKFPPDDDDALEADQSQSRAGDLPGTEDETQIEGEEVEDEDDEDESDGIGAARP